MEAPKSYGMTGANTWPHAILKPTLALSAYPCCTAPHLGSALTNWEIDMKTALDYQAGFEAGKVYEQSEGGQARLGTVQRGANLSWYPAAFWQGYRDATNPYNHNIIPPATRLNLQKGN